MSDDEFDVEQLVSLVGEGSEHLTAFKRAIVEDDNDENVVEIAQDLWTFLEELEDVLQTIDFEELPDAIDVEELPDAVDVEDLPENILDEDEAAIDLTHAREAVELRELWDAVNLTELYEEKQELEASTDDLTDTFGDDDDGDDLFENVVETAEGSTAGVGAAITQAALEEKIEAAVEEFREALLSTHELLRKLYVKNQEKLGQPGRQPDSLNPTAYSSLPSGPVPDSASTRTSTVPSRVKYSRVEPARRIYGRRFEQEQRRRENSQADSESAEGDHDTAAETDQTDATDREDEEETTND